VAGAHLPLLSSLGNCRIVYAALRHSWLADGFLVLTAAPQVASKLLPAATDWRTRNGLPTLNLLAFWAK